LRHDFPDVRLVMVGPDRGDGTLEETVRVARELGVERHVQFRGAVPKANVSEALGEGDIFLNTTNIDNTPVTVLEAQACGLCVVSTSVGGIPYVVEHGETGLLVEMDAPRAMSEAIREILRSPALAERLSRRSREYATTHDWSLVLPEWERLFRQVALTG
jgi:glycosyltransferase involved in cell wall biosynthesis